MLELTDQSFEQEMERAGNVVLVDFYTPDCQPCKVMHPILEKVAKDYEGRAACARMDADKNPQTAERFRVRGVPAFVLFVKGEQKKKLVGIHNEQTLKSLLDSGLDGCPSALAGVPLGNCGDQKSCGCELSREDR